MRRLRTTTLFQSEHFGNSGKLNYIKLLNKEKEAWRLAATQLNMIKILPNTKCNIKMIKYSCLLTKN